MSTDKKFQPGDIVVFGASYGPRMVVRGYNDNQEVVADWFSPENHAFHQHAFVEGQLKKADVA